MQTQYMVADAQVCPVLIRPTPNEDLFRFIGNSRDRSPSSCTADWLAVQLLANFENGKLFLHRYLEGIDRGLEVGESFDVHIKARGFECDLRVF